MNLLTQVQSWHVKTGLSAHPALLSAARLAVGASVAMAMVWLVAMWAECVLWDRSGWPAALGTVLSSLWLWRVRRLWLGLGRPQAPMTLCWMGIAGPDPRPAGAWASEATADVQPRGGWQVPEWRQAVSVRRVFDWQSWMLLKVESDSLSAGVKRVRWAWVSGEPDGASAHALRSLLALPARMTEHRTAPEPSSAPVPSP